jgi:hypothetical protein
MVNSVETMNSAIQAVKDWFRQLPSGIAEMTEDLQDSRSTVITIVPGNRKSSEISLHFSPEGVDAYCARHSAFEDIPLETNLILDLCESVRSGRISIEVTHPYRGLSFQERSIVKLSNDVWYDTYGGNKPFAKLFSHEYLEPQTIHFEPWDNIVK